MTDYILSLQCPDQPGIVRSLAQGLVLADANILESAQFSDPITGLFCMRVRFESPQASVEALLGQLMTQLAAFDPVLNLRPARQLRRALVMVSKHNHCLVDLLYRREISELAIEMPLIVSNHPDLGPLAKHHGVPYYYIPVTPDSKADAEAQLRSLIAEYEIDVVVLARYMQVLSESFAEDYYGRIINIHHSFLPGFKGANPYLRAYERGVKMIGATAHFVTQALDEGPIIEQDVIRVSHNKTPEELVALGRDVERLVLARAVMLYAADRLQISGARTVIFD